MNRNRVFALMRKDLREVVRNKQAFAPLLVIPVLFVGIIPAAVILLSSNPALLSGINGLDAFLRNLPTGILPAGATLQQNLIYAVIVYFLAPLFLMIPLMIATVTASSSFVGEKERRTIEGLLYTPLTDRELVMGKVLTSVFLSVFVAWASFVVYVVLVNALGFSVMGGLFFPTVTWGVIIVALVPLVAFLATSLLVAVSGRSTTMQGAQSIAVIVLLPVLGLVVGQASGLMLFDAPVAMAAAGVLLVLDVAVYFLVVRSVSRERIITRL